MLISIFGEMTRKVIVPPAMFGNAVGKLKDCLGVDFGRRQSLANRNQRSIQNRWNMIIHRLDAVLRCRFSHSMTTNIELPLPNI
jgi:hypothetical protein